MSDFFRHGIQWIQQQSHDHPWQIALLLLIGAASVARTGFQVASVLMQTFVLPGISIRRFGAGKGAWAVVTGASDGIGREFALQLAKSGFNILLVARNETKLCSVAEEIGSQLRPTAQTKVHVIDFAHADEAAYKEFASVCSDLDIGVLVNNVGKSHVMPTYFIDTLQEEMDDILEINIRATLRVTSAILPGMMKKKRGLVLNVGSFAGAIPSPMLATYSGSKAFLATFSSALAEEVRSYNILVEHLNTFFVVSNMSKIRKPSLVVPSPAAYVRSVLSKLGLACGAAFSGRPDTSTPFWSHSLGDFAMTLIGSKPLFIAYTHRLHQSIRKRAVKKLERQSKSQ